MAAVMPRPHAHFDYTLLAGFVQDTVYSVLFPAVFNPRQMRIPAKAESPGNGLTAPFITVASNACLQYFYQNFATRACWEVSQTL
jgi:hypothetical protein